MFTKHFGDKQGEDRVTLLVYSNNTVIEKQKLLVIGKIESIQDAIKE